MQLQLLCQDKGGGLQKAVRRMKLARSIRKHHQLQDIPNSGSPESSVGTVPESILSNSATSAVSRGNERKAKM
jgi:hypothetical protein